MRLHLLLTMLGLLALAACGNASVTDDEGTTFAARAVEQVPPMQEYDTETLTNIAANVCNAVDVKSFDQALDVLAGYDAIPAEERRPVAALAVRVACPELGDAR